MHNKKGSPKRLGKPLPGQRRKPTSSEAEFCNMRRDDYICAHPQTGRITIERCTRQFVEGTRTTLSEQEAQHIILDLFEYWAR